MRSPWRTVHPDVLVHCAWNDPRNVAPELVSFSGYWPAKKGRDAKAALDVCDEAIRDEVLDEIERICLGEEGSPTPIVVAPSLTTHDSSNALSRGYGLWLANHFGWAFDREIFQSKTMSRDFETDMWFRIANEPAFYGQVRRGGRYVIADDVCAGGGTVAALRGFIEGEGGHVICITALAAGDGSHPRISLDPDTLARLNRACGGRLANLFRTEIGHGLECVTEQEGRFLLRERSSDDAFRDAIRRARDQGAGRGAGSAPAKPPVAVEGSASAEGPRSSLRRGWIKL